jgi:hypothetical protein
MPNWVSNWVSVQGKKADVERFIEKAQQPRPTGINEETGELEYDASQQEGLSFWNFVAPPEEAVKSGEYFGTRGFIDGEQKGDSPNNWYSWNSREWGTKWDACHLDPHEIEVEDDNATKSYSFETAWGIPEPVFEAMVKQHPELNFDFECEEEQGWGAEYRGEEGEISLVKQWDIPDSHADYVERDREHSCNCAWSEDTEDWYADCPLPEGGTAGEEAQIIYQ